MGADGRPSGRATPGGLVLALLLAAARVAGNCGPPPTLENGSLTDEYLSETVFLPSMRVSYTCHPGYQFKQGSSRSVLCRADSTWSPLRAACVPKSCGNPGDLLNGYYKADDVTFGNKVTFYCDEGYKIVGRPYRLCTADGWDGQVPTCETVKCPDLPDLANGRTPLPPAGEFWEYGMIAKFSCDNDYSLVGAHTLHCKATGEWDKAVPTCKIVRCTRPVTPENGEIYSGLSHVYKLDDAITYRCNPGYVLIGSSTIYCTASNNFEPSPPTCQNATEVTPTTVFTTSVPGSQAGRNVGRQYGLLIILGMTFQTAFCCI